MDNETSQLGRTDCKCETFLRLASQCLVRFPKALQPYGWAFVWGVVVGSVLSYREPSIAEKMYDEQQKRARQILQESRQGTQRHGLQAGGLYGSRDDGSPNSTLMELIILRDIAAANEQAWAEQRLLYEQLIADFEPPA